MAAGIGAVVPADDQQALGRRPEPGEALVGDHRRTRDGRPRARRHARRGHHRLLPQGRRRQDHDVGQPRPRALAPWARRSASSTSTSPSATSRSPCSWCRSTPSPTPRTPRSTSTTRCCTPCSRVYDPSLSILAAPTQPEGRDRISPSLVRRVIDTLRRHFDYVVIDTPPGFDDQVLGAFDETDECIVVATLDVPTIKNTKVALETLDLLHLVRQNRHLVLNRADEEVGLSRENVEGILNMKVAVVPAQRHRGRQRHQPRPADRAVQARPPGLARGSSASPSSLVGRRRARRRARRRPSGACSAARSVEHEHVRPGRVR